MSISSFLQRAITQIQTWLGLASVLFILYAAFLIWSSGDNPTQRARGWRQLAMVGAGLVLVLFARDLINIVYGWANVPSPLS